MATVMITQLCARLSTATALSCGLLCGLIVPSALAEGVVSPEVLATEVLATEDSPIEAIAGEDSLFVDGMEADIPEEILRTEIITDARSPITGKRLSAADYAQLQAELAAPAGDTLVSQDVRYLFFLLQFRRAIQPILPFLP